MAAVAAVVLLLFLSGPAAVSGFVAFSIVDAINGEAARALAHVGQEVLEGVPAFADGDTFGSVLVESAGLRVFASLENVDPSVIGRGFRQPVRRVARDALSAP